MFSINLLTKNFNSLSAELSLVLKKHHVAPVFASCVGSCVYQMKSSDPQDTAYKDLDILVFANNLKSNQAVNFSHTFKNFKLDIQALAYSKAQELMNAHYLFILEACLTPADFVFISPPKNLLSNLKFSKSALKLRSQKVMSDTINKSFNLLSVGFAQNNASLIEQGKKLTWQAMRVDKMSQYLVNHPPSEVAKSPEFKADFFSIANVEYEKLLAQNTPGANAQSIEEWCASVHSISNHFVLNDFNTVFTNTFSPNQEIKNINDIQLSITSAVKIGI